MIFSKFLVQADISFLIIMSQYWSHSAKEDGHSLVTTREAMIQSALLSAKRAHDLGMGPERIIISCKVSEVQDLIGVYGDLAQRCNYALHLGLTEAGLGSKGIVASTAGMAVLMQQGIGDTIRVSLTPEPGGDRTREVIVAQEMLQTMGLRSFLPLVTSCPGCGRTTSTVFQDLTNKIQITFGNRYPSGARNMTALRIWMLRLWAAL